MIFFLKNSVVYLHFYLFYFLENKGDLILQLKH